MTAWGMVACLVVAVAVWPGRGRGPTGSPGPSVTPRSLPTSVTSASPPRPLVTDLDGDAPAGLAQAVGRSAVRAVPGLEVAATIDLIVLCLAGGGGVVDAVDGVATVSAETVRQRLATVVAAVRWGVPWGQAWALAGAEWRRVGTAFALADQIGVAPTGPLARASADLRTAARHEGGLAAARLGVRLVLPLGLTFLPAFVLLTVVPLVGSLAEQLLGP